MSERRKHSSKPAAGGKPSCLGAKQPPQQLCSKDVQGWWLYTGHQVKSTVRQLLNTSPHPQPVPKFQLAPTGKETPLAAGCSKCQPWQALPKQGSVGALRSKKTFHRLLGFYSNFLFFFLSPSCTPWAGGWVAASAVGMGGKKLPLGCTRVSAIIEKEPPKKWGGEGQAGGELLAGAAAA